MKEDLIDTFKISRLVAADIAGCLDDTGRRELDAWLRESDENQAVYREIRGDFEKGKRQWPYSERQVEQQLAMFYRYRRKKISRGIGVWWRYAAVLVLLLGIAGVIRWQAGSREREKELVPIQMAQGNAVLVLSTGERIALDDTLRSVRGEASVDIRVADQKVSYRKENESALEQVYNTLVVPRAGEFKVELADGTNVWLNAQSELRYPVQFCGKQRVVYLKGEGYFEVASDREKPFIVKTFSDVDIKVLGTKFNVSSYENDAYVTTTLAEGSVEVVMSGESVRISPDEQLVFNKNDNSFRLREVDASIYSAWKDGLFIFEDQRLEQIMEQLKRWYEMDVFYSGEEVKNYQFSGDLKKYDSFEKIVKMLEEVAGVKIDIKGKCVTIGAK